MMGIIATWSRDGDIVIAVLEDSEPNNLIREIQYPRDLTSKGVSQP
jgi:hypothetical protein